jgi:hypothetical protein
MNPQDWTRIISTSVVPVAIISASALLCLAFYNRLSGLISRLRGFQRERLAEYEQYAEHVRSGHEDASSISQHQQMLGMLEVQTKRVYRRAKLVRGALLHLLAAIGCLVLCSLSMGLGLVAPAGGLVAGYAAQAFFVFGMILLLGGAGLGFIEMWNALEPIQLETKFVSRLSRELDSDILKDESALPDNGHDMRDAGRGARDAAEGSRGRIPAGERRGKEFPHQWSGS